MNPHAILKQTLQTEMETQLNTVISIRQQVSLAYQALACNFQRDQQKHIGTQMFFWRRSDKVRMDARRTMRFLVRRGGRVQPQSVPKPTFTDVNTIYDSMKIALDLENKINQVVRDTQLLAWKLLDNETAHIEEYFLRKQRKLIKKIADNCTILTKNGQNLGESVFDQLIMAPLEQQKKTKIMKRLPACLPPPPSTRTLKSQVSEAIPDQLVRRSCIL